jgi:hypothetical protein
MEEYAAQVGAAQQRLKGYARGAQGGPHSRPYMRADMRLQEASTY